MPAARSLVSAERHGLPSTQRFAPGSDDRAERMFAAIEAQEGARLPGSSRFAEAAARAEAIELPGALHVTLKVLAVA